jgi:hypothetical protein
MPKLFKNKWYPTFHSLFHVVLRHNAGNGSLPHLQKPPRDSILIQLDPANIPASYFSKNHLNIIFQSTTGSTKLSLSFRFPHQNPVQAYPLPHTRILATGTQHRGFARG